MNASQALCLVADLLADISKQSSAVTLGAAIKAAQAADSGQGYAAVAIELNGLAARSAAAAEAFAAGKSSLQGDDLGDLAEIATRIGQEFKTASLIAKEDPSVAVDRLLAIVRKDASGT